MKEPKVLIIDSDEFFVKTCKEILQPYVKTDSINLVDANDNDYIASIADNYSNVLIDGNEMLTRKIRSNFKGQMIATSNHERFNDMMVVACCNTKIKKDKIFESLLDIIDLDNINCLITPKKIKEDFDFADTILKLLCFLDNEKKLEDIKRLFAELKTGTEGDANTETKKQLERISKLLTTLEAGCQDEDDPKIFFGHCAEIIRKNLLQLHGILYQAKK